MKRQNDIGPFAEGRAAALMGRPLESNPYTREIIELNLVNYGTLGELRNNWNSGWIGVNGELRGTIK